ncbi:hypothetical protein [Nocardia abscessus]|uniref:hypothetical protein n=1 Tax=Nocardia abscessus TaxID=120957 RepID=UPI002457F973|nr:hypothetical protein [Nocardia abscessus]
MTGRTTAPLGVGIVGANPTGSWAAATHLPALAQLPEFRVTAVATTKRASAEASGARHAFTDATELVAHPEVDLVVAAMTCSRPVGSGPFPRSPSWPREIRSAAARFHPNSPGAPIPERAAAC